MNPERLEGSSLPGRAGVSEPGGGPADLFLPDRDFTKPRVFAYVGLGLVLLSTSVVFRGAELTLGASVQTPIAAVAATLALITGAFALVRSYSGGQTSYLIVGSGFLGAGLLDAYHAAVTSPSLAPSGAGLADLNVWSWTASRTFLAGCFVLGCWRGDRMGASGDPPPARLLDREGAVLAIAGSVVVGVATLLAVLPIPGGYSASTFLSRPGDLLPGLLFAAALVGYLRRGEWRKDTAEHWIVVGLILGLGSHLGFALFSSEMNDLPELAGRALQVSSYGAMLVGLMSNVHLTLRREAQASAAILDANAALAREIGVRNQAERVLQESEERLQDFLDHATDLIQSTDPTGRIIYVNEAWKRTMGYSDADVRGTNLLSVVHPDSRDRFRKTMERVLKGEAVTGFEVVFRAKNGEAVICSGSLNCRFEDGRPVATRSILRNVTEARRAEDELERSQANVHALFESTGDAIWSVDRDHRLITFNTAFALTVEAMTGRAPQIGDRAESLVPPDESTWFEGCYDRALAGTRFSAVRQDDVNGQNRIYELFFNPIEAEERAEGVVVFSKDITRRRRVEEALKRAKREAEEANLAKSQFMANMSHELRTPLNSVIGFANILLKSQAPGFEAKQRGYLDRILANGKHLLSLINEILDLSKIEAGRMELAIESVDLRELVRETLAQMEGQIAGRPVQLRSEVDGNPSPLMADPGKLKQIVINLVGNALKFTERGEVLVRIEGDVEGGPPARIRVRDTGIGIPEDRLEAIFEAFQQADGSTTRRFGGTGLGLTISRSLCTLMGYRITVESKIGQGSTFTVHLAAAERKKGEGGLEELEDPPRARWAPVSLDLVQELGGKTVLVVDDEADSRTLLTHYLEELGCRVVTGRDGVEGLEMARKERPDLITVDLMMPRMSGWELLRALKEDPALRDVPAVVVSVVAEEGTGQFLGAVDLLTKPVDKEELIRVLRRNVSKEAGRVLVVDDNPDTRLILQRYLREAGLVVHTVEHGEAALQFLNRTQVDLVLLDLVMPTMDGFTTLQRLRGRPFGRNLPVVVLTAKDLSDAEEATLRAQSQGVILKDGEVESRLREVLDTYFRPEVPAGEK